MPPTGAASGFTITYNKLKGSISTSTAICGISFASTNAIAPAKSRVNTDRLGDFSKN